MSDAIDFTKATPDEKEQLIGREFRNIHVQSMRFVDGQCFTEIIFNGDLVTLCGDPVKCLSTYLGGV